MTGRTIGTWFREEVAEPLGADFHIGLPESEEGRGRRDGAAGQHASARSRAADPESIAFRILASCPVTGTEQNTRAWRAAEIPVRRRHRQRPLGRPGPRGHRQRRHARRRADPVPQGRRPDLRRAVPRHGRPALGMDMKLGTGFGLMSPSTPLSPNERACFWGGWGGPICVIDLDLGLSVAYVMNKMAGGLVGDLRGAVLALTAIGAASAEPSPR